MFKHGTTYIWSSGKEEWEVIVMSADELATLQYLYAKPIGIGTIMIYRDTLNRYIGFYYE